MPVVMSKELIKEFIAAKVSNSGLVDTGILGVQLFRITEPVQCAPAVYEPTVVAIVSGSKEAIFDGNRHVYDASRYLCCSMSMPLESGAPEASPDNPLMGVYISLDTKVMTELAIDMESASGAIRKPKGGLHPQGLAGASWDDSFSDAVWRLLQLSENRADVALLGKGRLREVYYSVLKGEAGDSARRAFGIGNEISRSIAYLSSNLNQTVTIEDMADQVGMSRAVFHRKFKQATSMSPIQFIKSMRLNRAATKIAAGVSVNLAAMDVGYVSLSQFSREFKRMYGLSPKQWSRSNQYPREVM